MTVGNTENQQQCPGAFLQIARVGELIDCCWKEVDEESRVTHHWKNCTCLGKGGLSEDTLIRESCDIFMCINGNGAFHSWVKTGKAQLFLKVNDLCKLET